MAGANDDEWKEMIAEEIRHINAHKGEEGMLDEDERFIGGGEGGIGIMAGDEDGENRKTLLNWQLWRTSPNQVQYVISPYMFQSTAWSVSWRYIEWTPSTWYSTTDKSAPRCSGAT